MPTRIPSEEEAIEVWIRKWLGQFVRRICAHFDVDPRRLYEIWTERTHPGSRLKAWERFQAQFPDRARLIDPSPHSETKRIVDRRQMDLFYDWLRGKKPPK